MYLLIFFILLFQSPNTVALKLGPDDTPPVIMQTVEAEKLYQKLKLDLALTAEPKDEDLRMFAALTVALGTLPDRKRLTAPPPNFRERLDWEIRRGVRKPLQNPEPKERN